MKKLILFIIIALSFPAFAVAGGVNVTVMGGTSAVAGFCDAGCAGDINLCWTPDSTTADCSDGDTSASAVSDATLNLGKIVVTNNSDCYTFDTQIGGAPELGDPTVGSIEFKVNISVWKGGSSFFKLQGATGNDYVKVAMGGNSDTDIEAVGRAYDLTNAPIAPTTTGNKGENTDLRIRFMWRESGDDPNVWVEICNADGTSCATASDNTDYDWTVANGENVEIGNEGNDATTYTMWDIKIYSTWQGWDS